MGFASRAAGGSSVAGLLAVSGGNDGVGIDAQDLDTAVAVWGAHHGHLDALIATPVTRQAHSHSKAPAPIERNGFFSTNQSWKISDTHLRAS
jgi:hypothetical protein